jgi:hypothetical protein
MIGLDDAISFFAFAFVVSGFAAPIVVPFIADLMTGWRIVRQPRAASRPAVRLATGHALDRDDRPRGPVSLTAQPGASPRPI